MTLVSTLAIRNNNGWEVLLAQKNVIDFRRTLQPNNHTLHICENPGEYVIPGRRISEKEKSRLSHTAIRVFCEAVAIPLPYTAKVQHFYNLRDEANFWLLWAEDNWWMRLSNDHDLREKNQYFLRRDAAVSIETDTGRLVSSWSWERYGEVHMLLWTPINNALDYFNPCAALSAWQEGQYVLAQQCMAAYRESYPLIEVFRNRRIPSEWSDVALQYLVQNPMVTNIQVYTTTGSETSGLDGRFGSDCLLAGQGVSQSRKTHADQKSRTGSKLFRRRLQWTGIGSCTTRWSTSAVATTHTSSAATSH